jgi:hypothetical protein
MAMSFGPLSADGGERRLNVLITRARIRCEVFSSITADDIDLERGRSKGVAAFKSYLHFAQTGNVPLGTSNVRELDSPFEEEVYRALSQLGYDVVGQVGIAGFFVDLAIRDPNKPGRFILGSSVTELLIIVVDLRAIVIDFDNRFWRIKVGLSIGFGALTGCVRRRSHYAARSLRLKKREPDGPNEIKTYSGLCSPIG